MGTKQENRQLLLFAAMAYGLTVLLGCVMGLAYARGVDVSMFPNAQMYYPAAGVTLAALVTRRDDPLLPRRFLWFVLVETAFMVVLSLVSVALPIGTAAASLSIVALSVVGWVVLLTEKKEKRAAYGLRGGSIKAGIGMVALFLLLYFGRAAIACLLDGSLAEFGAQLATPNALITLACLPLNFFLVWTAFFGEEYGWRFYLQPQLQARFGQIGGVLLLGVVWGLWHAPVNFFYYSPGTGLASMAAQQITCITLGIFFAFAYSKTRNIWVPVMLHFLNNNLVPILSGDYSAEVLQNNQTTWAMLLPALLLNGLLFGLFLFSREFRDPARRLPTLNERADAAQPAPQAPAQPETPAE